jgi:glycosyltransferase involved in cell wall biosynthesis
MASPLVSILINNHNYGRFVGAAIDSALGQHYPRTEVIVVDDGSTDTSREVIASYGRRIVAVLKDNGGQGSAFNAGVAASRGEILCFLDADDAFAPEKVERVVEIFEGRGLGAGPAMAHHLLGVRDENDKDLDLPLFGKTHASPLNLYAFARKHRFVWYEAGPTTTISINRALAERLFPIPEEGVRISGDDFVVCGAFLLGEVYSLATALGAYRIHGRNSWYGSRSQKPREFLEILQTYLNDKLVENGLSPVISFEDSIYAWPGMVADRRWAELARHMLTTTIRDHDGYTLTFVYHTLMTIGMTIAKGLRRNRDSLLSRLSGRRSSP